MNTQTRWLLYAGVLVGFALEPGSLALATSTSQNKSPDTSAEAHPRIDPRAEQALRRMSDYLASLPAFSVTSDNTTEVVTRSGEKLQLDATSRVSVQRPNRLRSDRTGELADVSFVYDGRRLNMYGRRSNLYATTEAPPNLDAALDFAHTRLDIDAPAADLLRSDPYGALMDDVVSGRYVGEAVVDGVRCHHLAFRGRETDWQVWIEDGPHPLPRKYVIVTKTLRQAPEFTVVLHDWDIHPRFADTTFVFQPPPGAERIDFLARSPRGETRQVGGGPRSQVQSQEGGQK